MNGQLRISRLLAALAALAVACWGTVAEPAAADPGGGHGQSQAADHGQGQGQGQDKDDKGKDDKDDKGKDDKDDDKGQGNGNANGHGNGNANGHGNGNGNADGHGNQGNGNANAHGNGGAAGDPAGNNGTVKITPIGEADGIPQNTPHVACGFDIEWYGFDEGPRIVSTVEFAMQAPTSDVAISGTEPSQVFVGGDPATGAGTPTGFDGQATYYPSFDGEPHPNQGYHVKLTVHTPGSRGADTKHKVFWVQPCEQTPPETLAESGDDAAPPVEESVEQDVAEGTDAGVLGTTASVDDQAEESATAPSGAADVPNAVAAGGQGGAVDALASPLGLMGLGAGLLLLGAYVMYRRYA